MKTGGQHSPRTIVLHIHRDEWPDEETTHGRPVMTGTLFDWQAHYHPIFCKYVDRGPDDQPRRHVWTKRAAMALATVAWTFVIWRAFLSI